MSFSEHESARPPEHQQRLSHLAHTARLLTRRDGAAGAQTEERERIADSVATLHRHQLTEPHVRRSRSRAPRWILTAVCLLIVVVFAVGITAALWLRHAMHAALPTTDGTLHLAGLQAPVTVTRNAQGVPSIRAASTDDLLVAQGFVTAQDRLWQMDALRRHAAGELAEILGPNLVEHDTQQRYLQLRAAADRAAAALSPDQLHEFQMYARGVNAYIDAHRNRLPVEFRLLHYTPHAWTPRDSLLVSLVMWQDLTTSFPEKLDREALARHLSAAQLADLYPTGSWRDRPPTQPKADLTVPREIEEIPLDPTQSKLARPAAPGASANDLAAITTAFTPRACMECRAGSNNWAVSGAHSASGAPLLSNDMHLQLSVPGIWYEAVLHTTIASPASAVDVAGFTLPGIPWVVVGRNAHVAWSFTNLGADVQDLRIEHLRGSGAQTQFEQEDGTWSPVHHHAELVTVRGGHDVSLDVQTVSHSLGASAIETPLISPLFRSEKRALSLAWTIYDPACVDSSFGPANAATDGSSLIAALASFGGPSVNLIYADDHGHIGYHAIGRIPVRGAPVSHPRAIEESVPQTSEPNAEEDDEDHDESLRAPDATQARPSSPQRIDVAYEPARPRARRAAPAQRRSEPRHAEPPPAKTPAAPVKQSFTIGSPLSPVPIDALDMTQIWSGYIPYEQLPAIQDPVSGVIATANARITPDDYPYAITRNWADPYRVERIYRLLEGHSGFTPQALLAIQTDQHSEFDLALAQRLAYAIDHSSKSARTGDAGRLHQAADLMRSWNGEMSAGSPAAAIVASAHAEIWPALLVPQLVAHDGGSRGDAERFAQLYLWNERTTALESLLQHSPARWLPPGVSSWDDLLTTVVERGLRHNGAPRDLAHWQYGATHKIVVEHPLFAGRPWLAALLGTATGSGPQAVGGDATTIDALSRSFGPSERFTADLSDTEATLASLTTGESGNPASPWYLDQLLPWLHGTSMRLPLSKDAAEHTLTLLP